MSICLLELGNGNFEQYEESIKAIEEWSITELMAGYIILTQLITTKKTFCLPFNKLNFQF